MPLVNPYPAGVQIANVVPRPVGGSPSAGSYLDLFASAVDHVHALTETSGPTNLSMGGILDGEMPRRVSSALTGRLMQIPRLTSGRSTTSTVAADVDTALTIDVVKIVQYMVFWVIYYSTAATTTGALFGINFTGTLNAIRCGTIGASSTFTTVNNALLGQATVGPGSAGAVMLLAGLVRPSSAGTVALRYATGVSGSSVSVGVDSYGLLIER